MAKSHCSLKTARVWVLVILGAFQLPLGLDAAASVVYSGSIQQKFSNSGSTALGTFKPGFDPNSIIALYGDQYGNLLSFYTPLVRDGYFRPLSSGTWENSTFAGSVPDTTDVAGQRLWLLLFGDPNPDNSLFSIICTGNNPAWFAPADADTSDLLNCNTANTFVFGSGGNGAPLNFAILPFPEPSALCPLAIAAMAILQRRRRRRHS
jgi:hypothetical protein